LLAVAVEAAMKSLSDAPKPELPFEPLTVPNLSRKPSESAAPVSWFTLLTGKQNQDDHDGHDVKSNLTPKRQEAEEDQRNHAGHGDHGEILNLHPSSPIPHPSLASFPSVDSIALQERQKQHDGLPEPPELVMMRVQAQMDADLMLHDAEQASKKLRAQAVEQGYQDGYAKGLVQGEQDGHAQAQARAVAERELLRADIADFIAHIEAERVRAWSEMEPRIIEMVFALSAQVIKQEIEVNREIALSVVRNALRRVTDSTSLRIRVHADDLETVRTNRADLLTLVDGANHVEIIEDRRVGAGGCILETSAGSIDARIETQLETLSDALGQMVSYRQAA
jgi:flagellar assembly protein FliH